MNMLQLPMAAFLLAFSAFVSAQSSPPSEYDAPVTPPAGSDSVKKPDAPSTKTPSDPGIVVPPPAVGSDNIKTPPKNIDPEITGATRDIDRENREKSEDKQKSTSKKRSSKPKTTR